MHTRGFDNSTGAPPHWFKLFVNSLPLPIYRTTPEGKIVFCNTAFCETFGFNSPDELFHQPVVSLYHDPKDRGRLFNEMIRNGTVRAFGVRLKKKSGQTFMGSITARALYDDEGEAVYFEGAIETVSDADETKQTAFATKPCSGPKSSLRILLDNQGSIVKIGQGIADRIGMSVEELIGRQFPDFIVSGYRELFLLSLSDLPETGMEEGMLVLKGKDGGDFHLEFVVSQLSEKDDGLIQCVLDDVTQAFRGNQSRTIDEKFQGVLEMAGGVAHRLNQPLMIITNLVEQMMADLNAEDSNYKKVGQIHHQIQKLILLSKKIQGIKKYKSMDYVAGVRIVDIDKAS